MRRVHEFWLGSRILTSVITDLESLEAAESYARVLASDVTNVAISKDACEAPYEFMIRLNRAEVRTRPLAAEERPLAAEDQNG